MKLDRKRTIAIVDDDVAVAEGIAELLQISGTPACAFTRPHEFLAAAATVSFAAVILDLAMPQIDGIGVLQVLRHELRSDVPVILHSAYVRDHDLGAVHGLGVDAVLWKPVDPDKLLRCVDRVTAPAVNSCF